MCRYVNTTYTECSHSKTNTFRCDASFDAFPHSPTSACVAVEETRVRSSHPHCMTCRRLGRGQAKLNPVSSLASRLINFIDGALGNSPKTKAKAQAPKTTYNDPSLVSFFDTADDVKAPTTPTPIPTPSVAEPVDSDSWSTHVNIHAEDYTGINPGWGVGHRNRDSWYSYENGDESHFTVGPNPFRKKPITKPDDRASLPSRRSSPSSTSNLIPDPLNIRRSRAPVCDSLHLPVSPREIPDVLRAAGPRVSNRAINFALSSGGHYGGGNKRHGICILPEMEDTDDEGVELDIPSYHGSDASSEVEVDGTEINLNVPDYIGASDSEEAFELDSESTTTTPVELEAPPTDPAYDGSLYGDVVTALPDNWDWADSDPGSLKSHSRSPTPKLSPNRDELIFQHPNLRQNWSTGPRSSAAPTRPHFAAPAARVPGGPATHFDHFEFPVGGNEVPTYEGSLLGSISRYWG